MKIAIASRQVSGVTGTTTTILEHARRLAARGAEVHVYGDDLDAGRIRSSGARPQRILNWFFGSYFKRRFFNWRLERALAGRGFDLVWGHGDSLSQDVLSLHNCVHAAYEAVHGKALPKDSSVGRFHGQILTEQKFSLLIANSRLMKDEVIRRFGVPGEKVRVVYPGHDPERFRPQDRARLGLELRRRLGLTGADLLVGMITSGDFTKRGVSIFLAALSRLAADTKKKISAVVVGSESRLARYRQLAGETGLGPRVHFLPPVAQVERCYHALDIYVHPALYEEFGQSVQEAMACGVPVLTSARVGASELLSNLGPEARGLVQEKPEAEALGWELQNLIDQASLRARYAEQGTLACRANTWDENFKTTLASIEPFFK